MEALERYPWSGHSAIMGNQKTAWMDTEYVLQQFGRTKGKAKREYRQFVQEGIQEGRRPELTGGGLVRSLGGWSKVLSQQRRGQRQEADERILGSGSFVASVIKEVEDKQLKQLKLRRSGKTLGGIIAEECGKKKVSPQELQSGSRRSRVSSTRAKIAKRGIDELGLPLAEIARHLGVNTSSVSRAVARQERAGG